MIRTAIQLIIAVAIINALIRSGSAVWRYYQLKDEAEEVLLFGGTMPLEQLRAEILDKAEELDIPLDADDIDVQRDGNRTVAFASYVQPIDLLPVYTYPVDMSFTVEGFTTAAGGPLRPRR